MFDITQLYKQCLKAKFKGYFEELFLTAAPKKCLITGHISPLFSKSVAYIQSSNKPAFIEITFEASLIALRDQKQAGLLAGTEAIQSDFR